jgi:mRNA interferase MazF
MAGTEKLTRFSIYWVNLDPAIGHEIKKIRPVVIISPDEMNKYLGTALVAPLTTTIRDYPFRLTVKVDETTGQIALDQLRAVDKMRIVKPLGTLAKKYQEPVLTLLQLIFSP